MDKTTADKPRKGKKRVIGVVIFLIVLVTVIGHTHHSFHRIFSMLPTVYAIIVETMTAIWQLSPIIITAVYQNV